MRKLRTLAYAALVPLGIAVVSGCNRDRDSEDAVVVETDDTVESAEQAQEILAPVRAVALVVVEQGQIAAQRAGRPDVREYGQTVAADHRALIAVLDSSAASSGATLNETQSARELAHTARMAHAGLENVGADGYDMPFVRAQVESHRQLLDRLDQEMIPAATSARMQTLLQDVRATVEAHLTRARQLLGNLLGEPVEPPPAGAPQPQPGTGEPPPAQPPVQRPPVQTPPPPDTIPSERISFR